MCVWHCGVKDPDFSISDAKTSSFLHDESKKADSAATLGIIFS